MNLNILIFSVDDKQLKIWASIYLDSELPPFISLNYKHMNNMSKCLIHLTNTGKFHKVDLYSSVNLIVGLEVSSSVACLCLYSVRVIILERFTHKRFMSSVTVQSQLIPTKFTKKMQNAANIVLI